LNEGYEYPKEDYMKVDSERYRQIQTSMRAAHHKCKHLLAHYRFIKFALDVAPCVGATVSEDDSPTDSRRVGQ
jgi:hypothetical protein